MGENHHILQGSGNAKMLANYDELSSVSKYLVLDEFVYAYALNRFMHDATEVEKSTGKKLIC